MKKCSVCKIKKEYKDFPLSGQMRTRGECKPCYSALQTIKMKHRKLYVDKGHRNGSNN